MESIHRLVLSWIQRASLTLNPWVDTHVINSEKLELQAQIACGGSGMVYHAQESWNTKNYAVKLVGTKPLGKENERTLKKLVKKTNREYRADDEFNNLIEASARRNGNLTTYSTSEVQNHMKVVKQGHPNVVNLLAFADNDNIVKGQGHIMFFEHCNGGDLHGLIDQFYRRHFVVPEVFVWKVFESLLHAVAWLHKEHPEYDNDLNIRSRPVLIHGDINPPNVMLCFDSQSTWPTVKLGDLDAALPLWDDSTEVKFAFGKDISNPPEFPIRSTKADIWGIGATIHNLCHQGYAPLSKSPPPNVNPVGESQSGCQMYELPPHYSLQLERFVGYCLQMEPSHRLGARELLELVTAHIDNSQMREEPRPAPEWLCMEPKEKLHGMKLNFASEKSLGEDEEEGEAVEQHEDVPGPDNATCVRTEPDEAVESPENEEAPKWGGSDNSEETGRAVPGPYNPRKRALSSEELDHESGSTIEGFGSSSEDASSEPPRKKARTKTPAPAPSRKPPGRSAKANAVRRIFDMGKVKRRN